MHHTAETHALKACLPQTQTTFGMLLTVVAIAHRQPVTYMPGTYPVWCHHDWHSLPGGLTC